MSLRREIERLRKDADRRRAEEGAKDRSLAAPEQAWRQALRMAPREELREYGRLREEAEADSPKPTPEEYPELFELEERIMRRSAPTLADEMRRNRDLLWRELDRIAPGSQAATSRAAAVQHRYAPPVTDADEIAATIERLRGKPPDRVMEIVGLIEGEGG